MRDPNGAALRFVNVLMLKTVFIRNQIINTEWGGFSKVLPQTIFDQEMDAESPNRGEHVIEFILSLDAFMFVFFFFFFCYRLLPQVSLYFTVLCVYEVI